MLGSSVSLTPLLYKTKSSIETKSVELLNLEDVISTKVENISDQLYIQLYLPRKEYICPCFVPAVGPGRAVCTTIVSRSGPLRWDGTPSCTCASGAMSVPTVASGLRRRTVSCPDTTG